MALHMLWMPNESYRACLLWIYIAIVENMPFMDIEVYVYVLDTKVSVHIN